MNDSSMTPPGLAEALEQDAAERAHRIRGIAAEERPIDAAMNEWLRTRVGGGDPTWRERAAFAAGWEGAIAHRGKADPRLEDVTVDEGWLVETTEGCTCGTGGLPAHMPGCGSVPIAPLDEVLEAHSIVNGADTARTVVTLYSVVVHHPGTPGGRRGSRVYLPASTEADAWARGDAEVRRHPGSVVERVEVATVTSYQNIARTEVTR